MSDRDVVCEDLSLAIDDLKREGFRLDLIYPADDPKSAVLSRAGESVRVALADAPTLPEVLPPFEPVYVLTRAGAAPEQGRAGMLYRDLIPGRLGGRYIASQITIPEGGPVADWVHFHRIAVQLIVVRRGWVRVVYEDQGEPFVMEAGDFVLQPPGIRHRVLESSDGLEVIEIGAPALHATFADHELQLPNGSNPGKMFEGQRFLHYVAASMGQNTGLAEAVNGIADAHFIRSSAQDIAVDAHDGELVFGFVMEGRGTLHFDGKHELGPADAFVIPPGEAWRLSGMSGDFRLLHVTTARLDGAA